VQNAVPHGTNGKRRFKALTGCAGGVKTLSGCSLVTEFTEEFTMGNINPLSAGSILNGYVQNVAAKNTFRSSQFNEPPIRDADMAAEISRFIKSQILYQTNTAVYAQAGALNPSVLSFIQGFG
jgi:hypothetical protein